MTELREDLWSAMDACAALLLAADALAASARDLGIWCGGRRPVRANALARSLNKTRRRDSDA